MVELPVVASNFIGLKELVLCLYPVLLLVLIDKLFDGFDDDDDQGGGMMIPVYQNMKG